MPIPPLPLSGCALFFDFDGTLADLALRPDAVVVQAAVPRCLSRLSHAQGGAVAIVTGRPVAQIDAMLRPLQLPVAGVHGAERRSADGTWHHIDLPGMGPALALVQAFAARHPALLLEVKPGALALHYRAAPELEDACLAVMDEAQSLAPGMALLCGKRVVELKPREASKGQAVRSFMNEQPFHARQPWMFGDDVTDEAAFETVLALGGVSVKVVEGESLAPYRLPDAAPWRSWLEELTPP
jgi:trehalose 6-phosphate phosphatase